MVNSRPASPSLKCMPVAIARHGRLPSSTMTTLCFLPFSICQIFPPTWIVNVESPAKSLSPKYLLLTSCDMPQTPAPLVVVPPKASHAPDRASVRVAACAPHTERLKTRIIRVKKHGLMADLCSLIRSCCRGTAKIVKPRSPHHLPAIHVSHAPSS